MKTNSTNSKISTIKCIYIVVIFYNNFTWCFKSYIHIYWIFLSYRMDVCKFSLFVWNYLPAWNRSGNRTLLPALVITSISSGIDEFFLCSWLMTRSLSWLWAYIVVECVWLLLRIYFILLKFYYIFEYINEYTVVVQAFTRRLQRYTLKIESFTLQEN